MNGVFNTCVSHVLIGQNVALTRGERVTNLSISRLSMRSGCSLSLYLSHGPEPKGEN